MIKKTFSVITGTGSYIPTKNVENKDVLTSEFFRPDHIKFDNSNQDTIEKFQEITEIKERKYITDDLVNSDIAYYAAEDAIESSETDRESLDYIIVAHNFGDVKQENKRTDIVPSIASRVKHKLKIRNVKTVAYDISFGCPGWLQGVIQADYFIRSGDAKKALVIGAETLSRVSDPHDRDSMIYSDGAGATIIEGVESDEPTGILSHNTITDTFTHAHLLRMGQSYNPEYKNKDLFLKMDGHTLYKYALKNVPNVIKASITKAGLILSDIKKVFIHQANEKMDKAILQRLFSIYGKKDVTKGIMPMIISWLGNSSVATIPTLLDLVLKGKLNNHKLKKGDYAIFASVGAGMNTNSMVYKFP
jgi:3-oxoacyl-[acyl-carrier-protein] synthase-3